MAANIHTDDDPIPPAPEEALFELDLGANGGVLAPTTHTELLNWIEDERRNWSWMQGGQFGGHSSTALEFFQRLYQAAENVRQAMQYLNSDNRSGAQQWTTSAKSTIESIYSNGFPHSTSALGKRVLQKKNQSIHEAMGYLYANLVKNGLQFEPRDITAWKGFIEGLSDRFGIANAPREALDAALQSSAETRAKVERELAAKNKAFGTSHRKFERLTNDIEAQDKEHREVFAKLLEEVKMTHNNALMEHEKIMGSLQSTFKEAMALRAPVEYWEGQAGIHRKKEEEFGWGVLIAMLAAFGVTAIVISWAFGGLKPTEGPPLWKTGVLGLVGTVMFWGARLIVRIYMSHRHLANDAEERVTMIKTFLALHEEGKTPDNDDRKLVLGALFRTASDGIVKDDAVINPVLEMFTKTK